MLDLALFVTAQNQSMFWRVQVKFDNGFQRFGEGWIVTYLECVDQMWL
jgi:hypothetical protein